MRKMQDAILGTGIKNFLQNTNASILKHIYRCYSLHCSVTAATGPKNEAQTPSRNSGVSDGGDISFLYCGSTEINSRTMGTRPTTVGNVAEERK